MSNFYTDPDKKETHEKKNSEFSTSKKLSGEGNFSESKIFKPHPIDFSDTATQPPYYTYEEWNNICTCDCHKKEEKCKDHVESIGAIIAKIDKNINDHRKGEAYCQSGQAECKMPDDCKWHNSSFAGEYYRYRQDSIPKSKPCTSSAETAVFGNKNTAQSPTTQTLCCLHRLPRIKRKILPTVPSKELIEVYQLEDKENSMNNRFEQKPMLKNTACGIQWKNEKINNSNEVDSKNHLKPGDQVTSEYLLNKKLSFLDKYLQSQFEENQNYSQEQCNTSPRAIYEMVMDQILEQSVEYRSIKMRERTPSVSPGETTSDDVGSANDAEESVFNEDEYSPRRYFTYRKMPYKKRTVSTSSESSSSFEQSNYSSSGSSEQTNYLSSGSNEQTNYSSSSSNEQTNSWVASPKKYDDLKNSKLKVIYENPFSHGELFEFAQNDQNMNQVENPAPLEKKFEPVEINENLTDSVTVDEEGTIVVQVDGIKVVAPFYPNKIRNYVNKVQRTESEELERQRRNLAGRISRAKEDAQEYSNGKDSHSMKKKEKETKIKPGKSFFL